MKRRSAGAGLPLSMLAGLLLACDLTPTDRFVGALGPAPFVVSSSSVAPGTRNVPLNQPITLGFSAFLDPDSFQYFNAVAVQSGGITASGFVGYRMVDRTLTFFPTRDLRPELVYTMAVNPDTVRAVGGDPLALPFALSFQTAMSGLVPDQQREVVPRSFAADVAPLLAGCASCHGQAPSLPELDYANLVDAPSQQLSDRLLVRPFDAPRSYLMHKLLPAYPDRRFARMPPPWSDQPVLDPQQLGIVEDWIDTGAAP